MGLDLLAKIGKKVEEEAEARLRLRRRKRRRLSGGCGNS